MTFRPRGMCGVLSLHTTVGRRMRDPSDAGTPLRRMPVSHYERCRHPFTADGSAFWRWHRCGVPESVVMAVGAWRVRNFDVATVV